MADSTSTRAVVTQLFSDVASGNVEGVLAALSPAIVFDLPGNDFNTIVPNLRVWRGKDEVLEAFRLRTLYADVTEFEQRQMVVEDDRAFVVNYQKLKHHRTGMEVDFEFAMVLTVGDDGLVTHWRAFFDASPEIALFRSDIDDRLLTAVRAGDREEAGRLVRDGADPNRRDPATGLTTFLVAAGLGNAGVVRELVDGGADVFTTDSRGGATALHKAVQRGDLATVRVLVDAGAFVDAVAATTGHTPLMDALWYKWPHIARYLLELGAGVNLSTHYGFSMKEHFEYELNVNKLGKEKLLEAEQALKDRAKSDEDAVAAQQLMAAVTANDVERVRSLIASGADVDARYPVLNGFNDQHTPLLVAARDGHAEIAGLLLRGGADVNATEPTFGASPLHKAVYNGHAVITSALASAPAADLDYQGATNGYTALHDALWHGYDDCASILLDAGARVDVEGHDGKTALDIAAEVFGPEHPLTARIRSL
ncbi:ankyrin repeat domain-containing protein [Amycolatopsis sp. CA-128772]|uniref:ankyrin repeat domain-containing protein n=1 Tax=Amycolatopsis sp. CA-128772 TaxID=2073159 RepID=UPI000CD1BC6F|nr:ankyrin repeat domain-containing protein [Amycolatopsis sp. CA-128772]